MSKDKGKEWKERVQEKKWNSLAKRGYIKPESKAENDDLAKQAHGY